MNTSIFEQQNVILKFFTILIGIIVSATININCFIVLFIVSICYFLLERYLFIAWFKLVLKLMPFFTSLLVLGIIFSLSIYDQIFLIIRISYILLLSIYLIKTSSLDQLISIQKKHNQTKDIVSYLVATLRFIPHFIANFKVMYRAEKNVVEVFTKEIGQTYELSDDIWRETNEMINRNSPTQDFWIFPNLFLMIFLALEIICLSVKF